MKNKFLETIKIIDGEIYNLSYHQSRFESVLDFFHIQEKPLLKSFIKAPKKGVYRCRLIYCPTSLDSFETTYVPYTKRDIRSLKIVVGDTLDYSFKYLDRSELDQLFLKKEECDDILIVKNELITDTSIANVACYLNGEWLTPKSPLLYGTTRARLIEAKKLKEADIRVEELLHAKKIALMNAMIDFDILEDCRLSF